MDTDVRLKKETYEVLRRVPTAWWRETEAVESIAGALQTGVTAIRGRIQFLVKARLVERRRRETIDPFTEIRKVGK